MFPTFGGEGEEEVEIRRRVEEKRIGGACFEGGGVGGDESEFGYPTSVSMECDGGRVVEGRKKLWVS